LEASGQSVEIINGMPALVVAQAGVQGFGGDGSGAHPWA
jgi:hypothetical protein